jgi:hypothetical protein
VVLELRTHSVCNNQVPCPEESQGEVAEEDEDGAEEVGDLEEADPASDQREEGILGDTSIATMRLRATTTAMRSKACQPCEMRCVIEQGQRSLGISAFFVYILTFCVPAAAFGSLTVSGNLDCLYAVLKRRQSGSYVYS